MDIKKELKWGVFFSLIIFALIFFLIKQYQLGLKTSNQKSSIITNQSSIKGKTIILNWSEVKKHNNQNDCWLVINNQVYDVTNYAQFHPGGANRIFQFCGQEATIAFNTKGGKGSHSNKAFQDLSKLLLGSLGDKIDYQKTNIIPSDINKGFNNKQEDTNKDYQLKKEDFEN